MDNQDMGDVNDATDAAREAAHTQPADVTGTFDDALAAHAASPAPADVVLTELENLRVALATQVAAFDEFRDRVSGAFPALFR